MSVPFGVYVHWPFCARKCPYCDFNSHVREEVDQSAWLAAYEREIAHTAALVPDHIVSTVFFGGGTPSLMAPATVEGIIGAIRSHWRMANDVEVTLEANPSSSEYKKFADFRAAGVNRVSIGVQALHDDVLRFLGRTHSAAEARKAIETAARVFDRFSFDLMYARPDQTEEGWRIELDEALNLAGGHLSLYQLTIERQTPFYWAEKRGDFVMPDDDTGGAFYEVTQDVMDEAGLPAYEVSNHAAAGQESHHNLIYWRAQDFAGVGPGAHGRLSLPDGRRLATRTHRAPEIWLGRVADNGHGLHEPEAVARAEQVREALMMGLRLAEGVDLGALADRYPDQKDVIPSDDRLRPYIAEGYLEKEGARLTATQDGRQRLNALLAAVL